MVNGTTTPEEKIEQEQRIISSLNVIFIISLISFIIGFLLKLNYPELYKIYFIYWELIQIILFFIICLFIYNSYHKDRNFYRDLCLKSQNKYVNVVYFSFLTLSLTIFNTFLFPFIKILDDNFFSTVLQTESAVIAIIMSFTILTVQFVNEKYSQRFGEYYKQLWEWKVFLGIFLITIFISLAMSIIEIEYELIIQAIVSILVIYSFLLVPVFIWNSITIMRADNIAQYLAQNKIKNESDNFYLNLYLQLFLDLISYATKNNDYLTLKSVKDNIYFIIEKLGSMSTPYYNQVMKNLFLSKLEEVNTLLEAI